MLISSGIIEHRFVEVVTRMLVVLFADIKAGVRFNTGALDLDSTYEC